LHALDDQGRLIAADAQLRALELLGDRTRPEFGPIADRLAKCLNDYSRPLMASAQRRFLMKELRRLTGEATIFPTLAAEELAATYLDQPAAQQRLLMTQLRLLTAGAAVLPALGVEEAKSAPAESNRLSSEGVLRPSGLANVWQLASPDGRVVALLQTESVLKQIAKLAAADRLPREVQVAVWPPEREPTGTVAHLLSAGPTMPGWRLSLALSEGDGPSAASDRQVAVYGWIAVLVIVAMSIVAVAVAGAFRRQVRLTRLKNDLLATVSHELKTPLSSIRLLVDTLLDAEELDVAKARDYLRLVAKENARLSHLIDNFLSFSRMERGKQRFDLAEVSAAEIAQRAVEAAGERFQTPNCRLEVQAEQAPSIMADRDALVTAVLNLLENAYKYSGDSKRIVLRTYAENGNVCFAVSDNGIGLSARAARKVFRPFYQADRHLSREAGGCGLGLSIVKFIVTAHGGTVRVDSRPGQGSTFTLAVPCAPTMEVFPPGNSLRASCKDKHGG
jgi:signal transduction histidine kinase